MITHAEERNVFLDRQAVYCETREEASKGERGVDGRAADWCGEDGGGVSEMREGGGHGKKLGYFTSRSAKCLDFRWATVGEHGAQLQGIQAETR